MMRTILPALLLLAGPAAAQEMMILDMQMGDLEEAQDEQALRPLLAACLLGNGDAEVTAALFTDAGWTREDETDMGMIALTPPWGDPYVTIYDGGAICDVTSEELGLMIADQNLVPLLLAAQFQIDRTEVPSGCMAYDLGGGIVAELTSSGNDPTCQSDGNSNVRFTFSAP
jgi:hypothetical protein